MARCREALLLSYEDNSRSFKDDTRRAATPEIADD